MSTVPDSEIAKNFGEWHDRAINEPVEIIKYGRKSVLLVSIDTCRSLVDHYREVLDATEIDEIVADGIASSEVPPDYRWNSDDLDVSDEQRGTTL